MSEHDEQAALFFWAECQKGDRPELTALFAIPNGGLRNKATAGKLKAEGVKAGVPDVFLAVPRDGYCGLWLEMKYGRNGLTREQVAWGLRLKHNGYRVAVCYSWEEARDAILEYLEQ